MKMNLLYCVDVRNNQFMFVCEREKSQPLKYSRDYLGPREMNTLDKKEFEQYFQVLDKVKRYTDTRNDKNYYAIFNEDKSIRITPAEPGDKFLQEIDPKEFRKFYRRTIRK